MIPAPGGPRRGARAVGGRPDEPTARGVLMILTVTLNTELDLTYHVPRLAPRSSHRVSEVRERPGGKGVNVARVLGALGHEVTVTGFAGGPVGETLRASLGGGVRDEGRRWRDPR